MKVLSGRVVAGKVVVDGEPLAEGSSVTVLAPETDETFELSEADERALLAAIDEADRGNVVEAAEVLRQVKRTN